MVEAVKQWAGAGARVKPWPGADVQPLGLFEVKRPETATRRAETVAVVVDAGGQVLAGDAALAAVVAAALGSDRAARLAPAVSALAGDGRAPVSSPAEATRGRAEEKKLIAPPRIDGDVLEYWTASPRSGIRRWRFQLSSHDIDDASAQSLLEDASDPVALAETQIAQPADVAQRQGIGLLAARCQDARAMQALLRVSTDHEKPATRAMAVAALGSCRHAPAVPVLVRILVGDGFAEVRAAAAAAIAAMGKQAARPAIEPLEKARSGDPDPKVRGAADLALEKLGD